MALLGMVHGPNTRVLLAMPEIIELNHAGIRGGPLG
jgi:hypothetical protein